MNENLNISGNFQLKIFDAKGNLIEKFEEKNLVVTTGHLNMAKLLGGNVTGKPVSLIGVGTNGNTPAITDTTLADMFTKAITGVAYPSANSVRFSWSLEAADANGITIKEFGLLNEDNVLIARKVRAEIVKTSAVRLTGAWTITFN